MFWRDIFPGGIYIASPKCLDNGRAVAGSKLWFRHILFPEKTIDTVMKFLPYRLDWNDNGLKGCSNENFRKNFSGGLQRGCGAMRSLGPCAYPIKSEFVDEYCCLSKFIQALITTNQLRRTILWFVKQEPEDIIKRKKSVFKYIVIFGFWYLGMWGYVRRQVHMKIYERLHVLLCTII